MIRCEKGERCDNFGGILRMGWGKERTGTRRDEKWGWKRSKPGCEKMTGLTERINKMVGKREAERGEVRRLDEKRENLEQKR